MLIKFYSETDKLFLAIYDISRDGNESDLTQGPLDLNPIGSN